MDPEDEPTRSSVGRTLGLAIGVGLAVGVATVGVVYAIIAIPFYALAQSDRNGLDRPFFRDGLVHWGIPIGVVLGVACGAVVGLWYARGGRLPTDRTPD